MKSTKSSNQNPNCHTSLGLQGVLGGKENNSALQSNSNYNHQEQNNRLSATSKFPLNGNMVQQTTTTTK